MSEIETRGDWHWTPELSVGVEAIDNDHKRLFQLFYEAHLISHNEDEEILLYKLAGELILYTESHFKREEALMAASNYPYCENHFAIHRTMINKLQQTLHQTSEGNESVVEFITFLKDWFVEHIKGTDQRISQYTEGFEQEIENALAIAGPLTLPSNITIYVVDDEPQQVEMVVELIDAAGLKATGFTSASDFVNQPVSNHDIVLLDLNMPDMDGIEVMRILHAKGCMPSYVLISGFDERVLHSAKQFAEAKRISVLAALTKPLLPLDFIEKISQLYGERKLAVDLLSSQQKETISAATNERKNDSLSIAELREAIKHNYFVLFYQPQIELQSGKLHGFEALIRMQHPKLGLIFPDQFIGLAEQYHLIGEITDIVITLVASDYSSLCDTGCIPNISINISAQDLLDLTMPERLSALLKANDIPPESITVELTESAILTSVSDSLDILNRLRMRGVALSIDDFGTGHSSLVQLYRAPFTELKIDQHFVMKMMDDDEAMSIVKVCLYLAKELKMDTVAEGVETEAIWNKLKELGCDVAQGYYKSRPIPLAACCEWIQDNYGS